MVVIRRCGCVLIAETSVPAALTTSAAGKPRQLPNCHGGEHGAHQQYLGLVGWFLAGFLAVWLRIKYTNLFAAAVGNSAPIQARADFSGEFTFNIEKYFCKWMNHLISWLITHRVVQFKLCLPQPNCVIQPEERFSGYTQLIVVYPFLKATDWVGFQMGDLNCDLKSEVNHHLEFPKKWKKSSYFWWV